MNRDRRLEKLEAAAASRSAPTVRALVQFVLAQPEADSAAFWRWCRLELGDTSATDAALWLCGGQLEPQPGDHATYDRLLAAFYGGPGPEPDPAPMPMLELDPA